MTTLIPNKGAVEKFVLIEYPINDADRTHLIALGTEAVRARDAMPKRKDDTGVTPEHIAMAAFLHELRQRLGVVWSRPAFLPAMPTTGGNRT